MNIYEKISAIMKEIQYLSKDDTVAYNNTKYKAITEEKVTSVIREQLTKQGLVIYPVQQTHKREGTLTTVDVTYRIVNIEKPEEQIEVVSSGTGADTQDKGVGKAMTYAYKYMLLRTFAIPTGEDPDKISNAELDEKDQQRKEKEQRQEKGRQQEGETRQQGGGDQRQGNGQRGTGQGGKVTLEQRQTLNQYREQFNVDIDYWIYSNGFSWDTLSAANASQMIATCVNKYGAI
ncbi:MAG: ERF family protein [Lachnospiraceae bacterium]|nr:ERF family protein [Lachnospiraceae bacterium]